MSISLDLIKKFLLLSGKAIAYAFAFLAVSVAGAFIIAIIVIIATKRPNYPTDIFSILGHYDHEFIIGASSILASIVVIFAAYLNIRALKDIAKREDNRKFDSAMSILPMALKELSNLCTKLAQMLEDKSCVESSINYKLSENSLRTMQLMIEYSNSEDRKEFRKIPMYYQIVMSKFEQRMDNRRAKNQSNEEINDSDWRGDKDAIIYLISLSAIAKCYLACSRYKYIGYERELAQSIFSRDIYTFTQDNTDVEIGDVSLVKEFDGMLNGNGDGFIDPNFLN